MTDRRPAIPESISEQDAARLLARASELDAAYRSLPELRAAAAEEGISSRAFDAALAELRAEKAPTVIEPTPTKRRPRRLAVVVAGGALLILILAFGVLRGVGPSMSPIEAPLLKETYLLRCLSPGEAAELIRPVLTLGSNQVTVSPANAPRALTVYGTMAQLSQVRTMLGDLDALGSAACMRTPAPAVTR